MQDLVGLDAGRLQGAAQYPHQQQFGSQGGEGTRPVSSPIQSIKEVIKYPRPPAQIQPTNLKLQRPFCSHRRCAHIAGGTSSDRRAGISDRAGITIKEYTYKSAPMMGKGSRDHEDDYSYLGSVCSYLGTLDGGRGRFLLASRSKPPSRQPVN